MILSFALVPARLVGIPAERPGWLVVVPVAPAGVVKAGLEDRLQRLPVRAAPEL